MGEHQRIDAFELWCWRRLLRVPWTTRRSNQSILKKISPEYSLEGLMLKLKLQHFGHLMWQTDSLEKTLMLGKIEGTTENEMARWHHQLDGHEFEWAPGVGDGQGSLACCSPWGCKELDTTKRLNWTDGRDWLRGKLGHVLMGGAILSKSLIPFSVDGLCSLLVVWPQAKTVVEVMKVMVTFYKKSHARTGMLGSLIKANWKWSNRRWKGWMSTF